MMSSPVTRPAGPTASASKKAWSPIPQPASSPWLPRGSPRESMIARNVGSRSGFASSRFWMIKLASGIFQGFLYYFLCVAQMSLFHPYGRKGDQEDHSDDPMKAPEDQQKAQVAGDLVDYG